MELSAPSQTPNQITNPNAINIVIVYNKHPYTITLDKTASIARIATALFSSFSLNGALYDIYYQNKIIKLNDTNPLTHLIKNDNQNPTFYINEKIISTSQSSEVIGSGNQLKRSKQRSYSNLVGSDYSNTSNSGHIVVLTNCYSSKDINFCWTEFLKSKNYSTESNTGVVLKDSTSNNLVKVQFRSAPIANEFMNYMLYMKTQNQVYSKMKIKVIKSNESSGQLNKVASKPTYSSKDSGSIPLKESPLQKQFPNINKYSHTIDHNRDNKPIQMNKNISINNLNNKNNATEVSRSSQNSSKKNYKKWTHFTSPSVQQYSTIDNTTNKYLGISYDFYVDNKIDSKNPNRKAINNFYARQDYPRNASPYISENEKRIIEEIRDKEKWYDKKGFFTRVGSYSVKQAFIPNYVNATPSESPLCHNFRDVKKKKMD